jgi:hypothetical protein
VHVLSEGGGRPWLVVVFEKARELVLVIESSMEMFADVVELCLLQSMPASACRMTFAWSALSDDGMTD